MSGNQGGASRFVPGASQDVVFARPGSLSLDFGLPEMRRNEAAPLRFPESRESSEAPEE